MRFLNSIHSLTKNHDKRKTNNIPEDTLVNDLEDALSSRFSFEGSFAFAIRVAHAQNPCLHIDGVGLIGLPLSDRDARSIVGCPTLVSHGDSANSLASEDVDGAWEIEPQKITFLNKDWEGFVRTQAVQTVCRGLGIQQGQILPRCDLHKVHLYGPGSHSCLHQQARNMDGIFGKMIVFLPSVYTGGQIVMSRGTNYKMFDFFQDSIVYTSILAWYTDVNYEVKPVTSGYYLALSYNLTHTSTTLPKPIVSDLDRPVQNLRRILKKWNEGEYKKLPRDSFVAYLLDHKYNQLELLSGTTSLKGTDAHKISFLRPIAEELGYIVCLGNLTYTISGEADDSDYIDKRRFKTYYSRSDDSDCDPADKVSMGEIYEKSMNISCLVDLYGIQILNNKLSVSNESLVPESPFKNVKPDEKDYINDMCTNPDNTLTHYYRRTVVVLVREEDAVNVFCSKNADGFDYVLGRLCKGSNFGYPTEMDKKIAYAMIRNLKSQPKSSDATQRIARNSKTMIDYTLAWDDFDMWLAIMECVRGTQYLEVFGTGFYFEAWCQFSFSKIEELEGLASASAIITQITQLRERLNFIDAIREFSATMDETIPEDWYKQKLIEALSTFQMTSCSEDADALIYVISTWGLRLVFEKVIHPKSQKRDSFDFWLQLTRTLVEKKTTLCVPEAEASDNDEKISRSQHEDSPELCLESEFNTVLSLCLNTMAPQWNDVRRSTRADIHTPTDDVEIQTESIDRIIQILDVCFLADCLEPCRQVLDSVLTIDSRPKASTDILPSRFKSLYIPLVPKFIDLLRKHNVALTVSPFDSFSINLIRLYLQYILGSCQSLTPEVSKLQKVGCASTCKTCSELDRFMVNINPNRITFRMNPSLRYHLEGRLSQTCLKRCNWITTRDGRFQVTKKNDYFTSMSWEGRKSAALDFLGSFGDDIILQAVMGPVWDDVSAALEGVRPFVSNVHHLDGTTTSPAQVAPRPFNGTVNTLPAHPSNPVPNPVQDQALQCHTKASNENDRVNKKRKRPYEFERGETIDLTKED